MKQSSWTSVLMGAVAASALFSIISCCFYINKSRQYNSLQVPLQRQLQDFNRNQALVNALVNDSLEYSKKNPAIIPVLQSVGINPANATPAPAKPATK